MKSKLKNTRKNRLIHLSGTDDARDDLVSIPPSIAGEESISVDMPDPESDDDMLANAHAVGTQLDEDYEHPEEVDIARDVDAAENHIRSH